MKTAPGTKRAAVRPARSLVLAASLAALLGTVLVTLSAAPTSAAGHSASIVDYAFRPSSITIRVGDRITWTNMGMAPHNVTFASFGSPYSMSHGASYTHTFGRAGTFTYTCTIHGFSGKVVVLGAPSTPRSTPKPTLKPTPKPTPKPTARPAPAATPTPGATASPTTTPPSASPTAESSPSEIALASPAIASASSATPASSSDGGATGPPLVVLVGLLAASVIAIGAVLLRQR